jgi:tetratricopeptide (TPR) repeat protein
MTKARRQGGTAGVCPNDRRLSPTVDDPRLRLTLGSRFPVMLPPMKTVILLVALAAGSAPGPRTAETKHQFDRGSSAYDLGDFQEAIEHFKAAYKQTPEPVFLFNIAQCYRQLKDVEHAQYFYRSYLRKAPPDAPNRADAERWIKELDRSGPPTPLRPAAAVQGSDGACTGMFGFEGTTNGAEVVSGDLTGFKSLSPDRTRPFCGGGALKVDAAFDLAGVRNKSGVLPNQGGQLLIKLPKPANLSQKTVTLHLYADIAPSASFGAVVFAVNRGKWVNGRFFQPLTAGKWWTITATFQASNRLYEGGSSPVDEVEAIALQVSAVGAAAQRTFSGHFYVDEVDWR